MWPSLKPSQRVSVVGAVNPQSSSSVQNSGWISAAQFLNFMVVLQAGALGASATLDCKIQQAKDSSGTGAKDIVGKAIVQLTKVAANDNSQCLINLKQEDFDTNNGFAFFQVSATPGTAASLLGVLVLGFDPVNGMATDVDAASVAQVVG